MNSDSQRDVCLVLLKRDSVGVSRLNVFEGLTHPVKTDSESVDDVKFPNEYFPNCGLFMGCRVILVLQCHW